MMGSTIRRRHTLPAAARSRAGVGLLLALLASILVFMVRGESGDPLTTVALGQPLGSNAMAVDGRTHHAFVATVVQPDAAPPTSRIAMLDTRTASVLATIDVGTNLLPLMLDESLDHLVVASSTSQNGGVLRLLDAQTGAIVRSTVLGLPPISLAVDGRAARIYVVVGGRSTCATIGCPSMPAAVGVFDARTLRLLRTEPVDRTLGDVYVDERHGRVFVPTSAGLVVLDAVGGRLHRVLPGRTVLAVNQLTGSVMVTTADGLAMLDAGTGHVLWRRQELIAGATLDEKTGNVLVLPVGTDAVEALSGTTGVALHSVSVGRLPVSIVIDGRARLAYVVNHEDHDVSLLDLRTWRVRRTASAGPYPLAALLDPEAHRLIIEDLATNVPAGPNLAAWAPAALRRWLPFLPSLPVRSVLPVPTSSVSVLDLSLL